MTQDTDMQDLGRKMGDIREKSKQLNDTLQDLAKQGFGELARAVSQATQAGKNQPARRDAGGIVTEELSQLMRREIMTGIAMAFGGNRQQGVSVVVNNNANVGVTATERNDGQDRKVIEIMIDQMVANALARGPETTSLLRAFYGLLPNLLGR